MKRTRKIKNKQSKFYRSLITTLLLVNGFFQLIPPALADGTAAGQDISNTATATYKDDSGNDLNATSNTVTVKIGEVAGITITKQNYEDNNGGEIEPGDKLKFKFEIKNVGNDPTKFHIPDKTNVGISNGTVDSLEYSIDGTNWISINNSDTPSVDAGKSIFVRVNVTVKNDAQADDKVTVTLGNTPVDPNDYALLLQNQERIDNNDDVYTVDNTGTTNGDIDGNPANGVREAGAFQTATVKAKKYALATILKTKTGYDNAGTAKINDDSFTYDLTLKVEGTDPTGNNIIPGTLVGTKINLNGTPDTIRILVSDAIPKDTELGSVPTTPTGWIAVYTEDAVTTNANTAQWKTLTVADLSKVKRIGFVNDPAGLTSIDPGAPEIKFPIKIKVKSDVTKTSLIVENIAQIFGQTKDGTTLVYDESGDNRPSNYGDDGSLPPGTTDANGDKIPDTDPTIDSGYIDNPGSLPETDIDKNNDNSGKGLGGEPNRFVISNEATVKNGPKNAPEAIGPTTNETDPKYKNDDFTNKSTTVPADKSAPGSKFDPDIVTFENTVKNTSTLTNDISLLPTPSAGLPKDTTVTISYGGVDKVYTWDGTNFTSQSDYITIKDVAAGASVTYTVKVDLPNDTPLSTDTGTGFPVAIAAFVDDATPGLGTETARNITIDRVYTGFLKMLKVSRILQADGLAVGAGQGDFESTPTVNGIDPNPSVADVARTSAPGNIIEYQIRYKNISQTEGNGSGNVLLNAKSVEITEDGTAGTNNWAKDNNSDNKIDTTHVSGQAIDTKGSIEYYTAPSTTAGAEGEGVTKYVDKVTDAVAPGAEGTFTFQRKVYKPQEANTPSQT